MELIKAENISISFDGKKVLNNFSFTVKSGEFIGVLGPNGAGKSTLLKLILGMVRASSGQLTVLGHQVGVGHKAIGYLPQSRLSSLPFSLTGYQLLASAMHAHYFGLPVLSREDKQKLNQVLADVDAEAIAQHSVMSLSGGERQRLLLAQALLNDPKLLLLDEPLNNLDPRYQESLIELIAKIARQRQLAVLLTAHDVNALLPVMDSVMYIVNGEAKLGSVDEVITSKNLSTLYGTQIEVLNYKGRIFVLGQDRSVSDFHHHCGDH